MARSPVVCGVDIGSTNSKVVAMDADGVVVARSSRPTPRDAGDLSIRADALVEAVEQMIIDVCADRFAVQAVSSAGVGEDGLLLDARRRPLTHALAWFDPRRGRIFDDLRPHLEDDDSFDAETDPVRSIVGWSWARSRVEAGTAAGWVALTDVAGVFWTGRVFMSDTLASRTAAWRAVDRRWAHDRVKLTLGGPDLLPPVVATGDVVGEMLAPALIAAGVVAQDALVVAGGHDHPIAAWGVQQMIPGAVLDSMGTAEVVVAGAPHPPVTRPDGVETAPGIRSSGTMLLRVEELARNVQWAQQDVAVGEHIRALLDGVGTPLPVLDSEWFRPGRRGGGAPSYAADTPSDPRVRASAVLGALAHSGRDAVEAVTSGSPDHAGIRMTGGWVRSPGWVDIKSAVNGYATEVILEPEVTAVGAALLAATALGWSPDPAQALSGRRAGR